MVVGCTPATGAQDGTVATVGILRSVPDPDHAVYLEELRLQGWNPLREVRVLPPDGDTVLADVDDARRELDSWLEDDLDLVIAYSTPFARLVVEEYPGLSGLFVVNDPVSGGLVATPDRPDGGLTGIIFRAPADRTLALGAEVVGGLERVGYVWPSDDPAIPGHRQRVLDAAADLGIDVVEAIFTGPDDVPDAIGELAAADVDAVYLASSNATVAALDVLERELARHRLPAVGNNDFMDFAVVVLMPDRAEMRRQLARQTARLLVGTPATGIPVEDPRRFELILNETQAGRLGLPPLDADLVRQASVVR